MSEFTMDRLLIARRYEKTSTVFTSNKTFSQWNEVFADVTIASAMLDRVRVSAGQGLVSGELLGAELLPQCLGLVAAQHRFSTYYVNCHQLIEQLKKAQYENRL